MRKSQPSWRNVLARVIFNHPSPVVPAEPRALLESLESRSLLSAVIIAPNSLGIPSPRALAAATIHPHVTETVLPVPVADSPGAAAEPVPSIDTLTPTLTWHLPSTADPSTLTGFRVTVYNQTRSHGYTYTVTGAASTTFTVPAGVLRSGDRALWNVRSLANTRAAPPSAYLRFRAPTIAEATLPAPVAVSPGSTTAPGPVLDTLTPTFTWQPVPASSNATGYTLTVYDATRAKAYTYPISGISTTTFTLPASILRNGDKVVWNVRAVAGTRSGPPSAYLNFQAPAPVTEQPLPTPVADTPGTVAEPGPILTTLTPTFTWHLPDGTDPATLTGYTLTVYDSTQAKAFTYPISGASTTSFTLPSGVLHNGDKAIWNVRAINGTRSGAPSAYLHFQAPAPVEQTLPAPNATSPGTASADGPILSTLSPTFTWDPVSVGTGYQVSLYDKTAGKSYSYTVAGNTTSSYTVSSPLPAGHKFVWNVRVLDTTRSGPPSTYLNFQTPTPVTEQPLATPVADAPGTVAEPGPVLTTLTPTFTWHLPTGADPATLTGYTLTVYDSTQAKTFTYAVSGASTTSFTLPSGVLHNGDKAIWNVRAVNGTRSGAPSAYLHFQAPAPVEQTLPAPHATSPGVASTSSTATDGPVLSTLSPTFTWDPVSVGTGYQINLYDKTAGHNTVYTVSGASTGSFTVPSPLPAGHKFVWNVRVLDTTRSGPPSAYLNFQTPAPVETPIPVPVADTPGTATEPGPVINTTTPTLTWHLPSTADPSTVTGYQLNVYDTTTAKFTSYTVSGASTTSFTLPASVLHAGDKVVWNVRSLAGTRTGLPGTYLHFQVATGL